MKETQKISQKSGRNVLSFFERRATSVLKPKEVFGTKSQIIGGVR
jgi:hypothetical protein